MPNEHMVRNNVRRRIHLRQCDAQALKKIEGTVHSLARPSPRPGCRDQSDIGRQAAMEDRERIAEVLSADMVFITTGMGGGTPVLVLRRSVSTGSQEVTVLTSRWSTSVSPSRGRRVACRLPDEGIRALSVASTR